jgi:Integron Cassette Protein Hfx_Cass5
MKNDGIAEIRIDATERLCVLPKSSSFPNIYRAGMEVHWDAKGQYPYSPKPREWSYVRWFQQILAAVKGEYGCTLVITPETRWQNIDDALKIMITSAPSNVQAGDQINIGKDAL